jgi:hypothetical protein
MIRKRRWRCSHTLTTHGTFIGGIFAETDFVVFSYSPGLKLILVVAKNWQ